MATILIIGYGNPLRRDDGIGWAASELLASCVADAEVRVLARHQLTPELAEDAAQVDRLILIDSTSKYPPGNIFVEKIEPSRPSTQTSSHHLTPTALLACVKDLYGTSPETWLISVGAESFDHGSELSPTVAASLPQVLSRVRGLMSGAA